MKFGFPGRGVRSAAAVSLAALFFLLAVGVTLLGSGVYRSVAADANSNYTRRTALSYVVNQIRRSGGGAVSLGSFGGADALCLRETAEDGSSYVTLIYCSGGQLRELYMEEGAELTPEDGVAVLPLDSLSIAAVGGALEITAASGQDVWSVLITPRSAFQEVGKL